MDHKKFKDPEIEKNSLKQKILVGGIAIVVFISLVLFGTTPTKNNTSSDESDSYEVRLVNSILSGNTNENNYALGQEAEVESNAAEIKKLKSIVEKLSKKTSQKDEKIEKLTKAANEVIDKQSNKILDLASKVQQQVPSNVIGKTTTQNSNNNDNPFSISGIERNSSTSSNKTEPNTLGQNTSGGIIKLSLTKNREGKNLTDYIPAGTYASAMIISGADTSVGINSNGDPKPVLLRIKGYARTANNTITGDTNKINLDGCLVTGQAKGELSSEKVYIRTMILSCSFLPGITQEFKMTGYVAGKGKAGIRGRVISREGDLIQKSFLIGLAGGIGESASNALSPTKSIITNGATSTISDNRTSEQKIADGLGMGLGKGFKNAADRISQYFIDRAEQYQPVITLQAGTEVEIIFIKGIDLKNQKIEKEYNNAQ